MAKQSPASLGGRKSLSSLGSIWFLLGLVIIIGAGLRFYRLSAQSLWLDEIITADVARGSPASIIKFCLGDTGPLPLSYLLVWLAQKMGATEFFVRLPDCLFGIISLPLLFLITYRLTDNKVVALLAALLLALSSFHHHYCQEARGYGLLVFLVLLSFYCLYVVLTGAGSWVAWSTYGASSLFLLYTSYFSVFIVVANFLYGLLLCLVRFKNREITPSQCKNKMVVLALVSLLLILAFLPWFLSTYKVQLEYGEERPFYTISQLHHWLAETFQQFAGASKLGLLVFLTLVMAGWFGYSQLWRQYYFVYCLLLLLLPPVVIYFFRAGHFLHPRFLVFILPFLIAAAGAGIRVAHKSISKIIPAGSVGQCLLSFVLSLIVLGFLYPNIMGIHKNLFTEKQDWRRATRFLEEHYQPGDIILGGKNEGWLCITYYIRPELRPAVVPKWLRYRELTKVYEIDRRIWYVTAFFRTGGGKVYYDWIEEHFQLVQEYPGTFGTIKIFLKSPPVP